MNQIVVRSVKNAMYQRAVPGGPPLPSPRPPRPRSDATAVVVLVFLFFFCAGGYVLFKYGLALLPGSSKESVTPIAPVKPAPATIPIAEAEDLLHHLEIADAKALQASAELKRSADWITRISPALEQNYLSAEKRRADAAAAVLDSARRAVQEARDELEIVKNLLRERSSQ